MGFQIEDGKGTGNQAEVKSNKLLVSGVFSTQEHYANHNQGKAFNLLFNATPTGAGDCFLYMKNEDPEYALSIEGLWLKMEADDFIDVKINDLGTPVDGNDITPVNLNSISASQAIGTFQSGNDITGLSGGKNAHKLFHVNTKESIYRNFNMDIVLGNNGTLSLYAGAGTVAIYGTLVFNYHGTNN